MSTHILLDDDLLQRAMRISHAKTKRAAIELTLRVSCPITPRKIFSTWQDKT